MKIAFIFFAAMLLAGCLFKNRQPIGNDDPFRDEPMIVQSPSEAEQQVAPPEPVQETNMVRWPGDKDLAFYVTYDSEARLQVQWRQVCGEFDSDWYDMRDKGLIDDPLAADYMIKSRRNWGAAQNVDTVVVMVARMRDFPRSNCEWSFRARLVTKRNIYDWVMLAEKIVLADPGEFENIDKPKIQLVAPAPKPD